MYDIRFFYTDLRRANLCGAILQRADLEHADLSEAKLNRADLSESKLHGANLNRTDLSETLLCEADMQSVELCSADLNCADLHEANLRWARLIDSNLSGAKLHDADLYQVDLEKANLTHASLSSTILACKNLTKAIGLDSCKHIGPSIIGVETLQECQGKLPDSFLRGCGMSQWEIAVARLYDPGMSASDVSDHLTEKVFTARTEGPIFFGGVFISYSHNDFAFADKIEKNLENSGAPVWRDSHNAVAGDLQKQIARAIRLHDVVLLVLSESSINSDWVEHELEMARKKEKEENRDVLCPVALDDSWKGKVDGDVLWRQLKKKNVLDFSSWKTKKFSGIFNKLHQGLKLYYPKNNAGQKPISND